MKREARNMKGERPNRKRVWNWIGLAMTAYTALSGIVLWFSILRGDLLGILEDYLLAMTPVLAVCPISVPICLSVFIAPVISWIVALLPLVGWLLLQKGSGAGRVLVILMMSISLLSAGVLFMVGSAAGNLQALPLCLPKVLVPLLTFNAMTAVSPAAASSAEVSAAGPTPDEDPPGSATSALPPS